MGDVIVVAAALFGVLVLIAGIGWFVPSLRRRFAGERSGAAGGPLPGIGLIAAGLVLVAVSLGVFSDGAQSSKAGDLAAFCELLDGGEDNISVEQLDRIVAVAPATVAESVRTVRDRFAEVGEAAFDEPEVVAAFERVGAFEGEKCNE